MMVVVIGSRRTVIDRIKRWWPPYRIKQDEETLAAIKYLCEHPEAPCVMNGHLIPHGYGEQKKLSQLFGLLLGP